MVLSCGGVGYYAQCPASVAGALPGVGKEATIYTVMSVTENDVEPLRLCHRGAAGLL
ncbi:MAG: OB-fold domain-containing protein [Faecalibacterium prausnitzii]